jgi:hypothetical protein
MMVIETLISFAMARTAIVIIIVLLAFISTPLLARLLVLGAMLVDAVRAHGHTLLHHLPTDISVSVLI